MEMKLSCLFALLLVGFSSAAPASEKSESPKSTDEVEFVPLGGRRQHNIPNFPGLDGFPGLAGEGGDDPYTFLSNMQEMITRLKQQMGVLLRRVPAGEEGEAAGFPGFNFAPPSFGHVDLGKGNTTSVTKIIDGHKVVINETTYQDTSAHGGSFFKVRIIDLKPDDEVTEKPTAASSSEDREVEAVEDSLENEISKTREYLNRRERLEEFDYEEAAWDDLDAIESIADNGISDKRGYAYDLSNDIHVNKLKEEAGAPFNPDAEFIECGENCGLIDIGPPQQHRPYDLSRDTEVHRPYDLSRDTEVHRPYDLSRDTEVHRPYDLSRDTEVNRFKKEEGAPLNPDAEYIDEIDGEIMAKNMRLARF